LFNQVQRNCCNAFYFMLLTSFSISSQPLRGARSPEKVNIEKAEYLQRNKRAEGSPPINIKAYPLPLNFIKALHGNSISGGNF
jgi:hypothetical protein